MPDAAALLNLGIDIGGSSVKAAALEGDRVLWTRRSDRYDRPNRAALSQAIATLVSSMETAPTSVGLCVPGLLHSSSEYVAVSSNVPGLVGVPLRGLLEDAIRCSLPQAPSVYSDAHAAAHDIVARRNLADRVAVISLGTGVGMSVLDDGIPLKVDGNSPGHIGQLDVSLDADAPIGPDGGSGGLEAYIGAAALARRYGSPGISGAAATDPPIRALVRAIRIVHAIYRPYHVVLAGGVGISLRPLAAELRECVADRLTNISREGWTLSTADHEFHAACGAASLAG